MRPQYLISLAAVVLLAGVGMCWWAASATGLIPRAFVPNPLDAAAAVIRGFSTGNLAAQTLGSVLRMLQGWVLASVLGILLGSLIGLSAKARQYLLPTLEFIRPIPASAVIPLAIAIFGLSPGMALAVIAFGSVWPVLLSTIHGFASVEPRLFEVAKCMEMTRWAVIRKIGLPGAIPDIIGGLRLSLTIALVLAIITEMLAAQTGLGSAIIQAARSFRAPDLFAGIIILGVIGAVSGIAIDLLERRLLRWKRRFK